MRKESRDVFIAEDGQEFDSAEAALNHEKACRLCVILRELADYGFNGDVNWLATSKGLLLHPQLSIKLSGEA